MQYWNYYNSYKKSNFKYFAINFYQELNVRNVINNDNDIQNISVIIRYRVAKIPSVIQSITITVRLSVFLKLTVNHRLGSNGPVVVSSYF